MRKKKISWTCPINLGDVFCLFLKINSWKTSSDESYPQILDIYFVIKLSVDKSIAMVLLCSMDCENVSNTPIHRPFSPGPISILYGRVLRKYCDFFHILRLQNVALQKIFIVLNVIRLAILFGWLFLNDQ